MKCSSIAGSLSTPFVLIPVRWPLVANDGVTLAVGVTALFSVVAPELKKKMLDFVIIFEKKICYHNFL